MAKCLIAMGANATLAGESLVDRLKNAVETLKMYDQSATKVSRYYETPSFPTGSGPDYVNAACSVSTSLSASFFLNVLHEIEAEMGRERSVRWGERTLDLDLIAYGDAVLPDERTFAYWRDLPPDLQRRDAPDELILPHPRMQDRAFVLVPLCDISPQWRHPVSGRTVREMANALPESERQAVRAL